MRHAPRKALNTAATAVLIWPSVTFAWTGGLPAAVITAALVVHICANAPRYVSGDLMTRLPRLTRSACFRAPTPVVVRVTPAGPTFRVGPLVAISPCGESASVPVKVIVIAAPGSGPPRHTHPAPASIAASTFAWRLPAVSL